MKNRWIILACGIVTLVVIGSIFSALFQNSSTTQTTSSQPIQNPFADDTNSQASDQNSISNFVKSCYQSYVKAYAAELKGANSSEFSQDAQQCFTSSFIAQWPTITKNSDADPVLLSQDYYNSWTTDVSTIVTSQNTSQATVAVNLGDGSELNELIVTLQFTSKGWRISSVTQSN